MSHSIQPSTAGPTVAALASVAGASGTAAAPIVVPVAIISGGIALLRSLWD